MLGAIAGDVIGSVHEGSGTKTKEFPLFTPRSCFTDDSVLSIAVADWILTGKNLVELFHQYGSNYPYSGYGGRFRSWLQSGSRDPYNSFGNGAAMRVSAVGFAFDALDEVLEWSKRSAEVTHNHPEGIRGAQATAAAILLARQGLPKPQMRDFLESTFGYALQTSLDDIRPRYNFDETCQGTVPQALIAFFESEDYEDAIRNAISLGGDADTLACIAGGVAEAFYGSVPNHIADQVTERLDPALITVLQQFRGRFGLSAASALPAGRPAI
jgi:ADP-ribosylglycohydrolase